MIKKLLRPWQMGTHMRVLIESYPMNTNMTGYRWFSKIFASLYLDESSLSIDRVKNGKQLFTLGCTCAIDVNQT